jgi:hypothetical protein
MNSESWRLLTSTDGTIFSRTGLSVYPVFFIEDFLSNIDQVSCNKVTDFCDYMKINLHNNLPI